MPPGILGGIHDHGVAGGPAEQPRTLQEAVPRTAMITLRRRDTSRSQAPEQAIPHHQNTAREPFAFETRLGPVEGEVVARRIKAHVPRVGGGQAAQDFRIPGSEHDLELGRYLLPKGAIRQGCAADTPVVPRIVVRAGVDTIGLTEGGDLAVTTEHQIEQGRAGVSTATDIDQLRGRIGQH